MEDRKKELDKAIKVINSLVNQTSRLEVGRYEQEVVIMFPPKALTVALGNSRKKSKIIATFSKKNAREIRVALQDMLNNDKYWEEQPTSTQSENSSN